MFVYRQKSNTSTFLRLLFPSAVVSNYGGSEISPDLVTVLGSLAQRIPHKVTKVDVIARDTASLQVTPLELTLRLPLLRLTAPSSIQVTPKIMLPALSPFWTAKLLEGITAGLQAVSAPRNITEIYDAARTVLDALRHVDVIREVQYFLPYMFTKSHQRLPVYVKTRKRGSLAVECTIGEPKEASLETVDIARRLMDGLHRLWGCRGILIEVHDSSGHVQNLLLPQEDIIFIITPDVLQVVRGIHTPFTTPVMEREIKVGNRHMHVRVDAGQPCCARIPIEDIFKVLSRC